MRKISYAKEKILLTLGYCGVVVIFYYFRIPCLWQKLLKFPCPGCGMTRALLAALRLDLRAAFSYHPMFWSLPILYLYFLLDRGLFSNKYINKIVLYLIGVGFVVQWIAKIVKC